MSTFHEGQIEGNESDLRTGQLYAFEAHFLGGACVRWRAEVRSESQAFCGELSGTLENIGLQHGEIRSIVDTGVRTRIRAGLGYRPL